MFGTYLQTLPPTVATWQSLLNVYVIVGTVAAVLVIGFLVYSIIRFRMKENVETHKHHEEGEWGNWKLAILLVVISASAISYAQFQTFNSFSNITPPTTQDPIVINVIARQWGWTFVYPNGAKVDGNLTVPAGETIILNITSIDVDHSLSIAELDVAKDAIPGVHNTLWFSVREPRVYQIYCKELCGVGHAFMLGKLTVVSPSAYAAWYSSLGG